MKPLSIGIDSSMTNIAKGRGLRRYILHLIKALAFSTEPHQYFVLTSEKRTVQSFLPPKARFQCVHPRRYFPLQHWPWMGPAAGILTPRLDIMHFPCNAIWENYRGKCLVTLGDVAPLYFPERFFKNPSEETKYKRHLKKIADRVAMILVHTDYVKQDIMTHLNVPAERVQRVYPIVDPVFLDARPQKKAGEPYFLFVGAMDFRKNIPLLLDAFRIYRRKGGRSRLVLVGRQDAENPNYYPPLQPLLDQMEEKKYIEWLSDKTDEELPEIYASASAFVFPSLFEGFGSPLVEAMACEIPILTLRKTCIPEVVGEAALFATPAAESLADALFEVEENQELRRRLIALGKERLSLYQPDRFAKEMVSIYEKTAG